LISSMFGPYFNKCWYQKQSGSERAKKEEKLAFGTLKKSKLRGTRWVTGILFYHVLSMGQFKSKVEVEK